MSQAKVCTATDVTLFVDGVEFPPVAIGSAPPGMDGSAGRCGMSEALNLLEALCLPLPMKLRAHASLLSIANAGTYSALRYEQVSADQMVSQWRAFKDVTGAEADVLRDVFALAIKARDDQPATPDEVAQAHARWISGLAEQLAKFATLTTLLQVFMHLGFVEKLLANVTGMGLDSEVVADHRRQLVEAVGAARRRLIPRWRELLPEFGAEFFAATEDEVGGLMAEVQRLSGGSAE